MHGIVKWFDKGRNFGYIESEKGNDVFFNRTTVWNSGYTTLRHGQEVDFELAKGKDEEAAFIHVLS